MDTYNKSELNESSFKEIDVSVPQRTYNRGNNKLVASDSHSGLEFAFLWCSYIISFNVDDIEGNFCNILRTLAVIFNIIKESVSNGYWTLLYLGQ